MNAPAEEMTQLQVVETVIEDLTTYLTGGIDLWEIDPDFAAPQPRVIVREPLVDIADDLVGTIGFSSRSITAGIDIDEASLVVRLHAAVPSILSVLNTARRCAVDGNLTGTQQGRDAYELALALYSITN